MAEFRYLKKSHRRILQAFADTLLPRGGAFEIGAADVNFLPLLDRYIGAQDLLNRIGVRYLIRQWNWLPILYFKSFKRFTSMTVAARLAFLNYVQDHRTFLKRSNAVLLRVLVGMPLYSDRRIEEAMGYTPHCADLLPGAQAEPEAVEGREGTS